MSEDASAASPSTFSPATGLALFWAIALTATVIWPNVGIWFMPAAVVVMTLFLWRFDQANEPRWLRPSITFFFSATSGVALFIAGSLWSQVLVVIISVGLLAWYLGLAANTDQTTIGRVVNLILALAIFFFWLALLSLAAGLYIVVPWWWLIVSASLVTTAVAVMQWAAGGVPFHTYRSALPLIAVMAAELFTAVWWLPTVVTVGSTIAATVIILWLQVCRHIWQGSWAAGRGRRYLVVGFSLVMLLLISARWH